MPTGVLELVLPDWSALDTVRSSSVPFALWTIGDQCLLHHWLDYAVNQGCTGVKFYVTDRPDAVKKVLTESSLWPLTMEMIVLTAGQEAPPQAISVEWLHGEEAPAPPTNGWELLARAADIEKVWLDRLANDPDFMLMNVGFLCRIHPEAVLIPPYFIGDHVFIGPGCEIGPYAVVGQGSVVSGANRVTHSHLSAHTFLGPVTALDQCRLESGILLNLKHRARLDELEPHLLSNLESSSLDVPIKDRLYALLLYIQQRKSEHSHETFKTFDGRILPGRADAGLSNRTAWLPLVWRGKMPLYGILPRSTAQFERLSAESQRVVRHAPIGVFSYADSQGCHSPEQPEEAAHAVYQASLPPETLLGAIAHFIRHFNSADLHP